MIIGMPSLDSLASTSAAAAEGITTLDLLPARGTTNMARPTPSEGRF
jgi:hypothetical protein